MNVFRVLRLSKILAKLRLAKSNKAFVASLALSGGSIDDGPHVSSLIRNPVCDHLRETCSTSSSTECAGQR